MKRTWILACMVALMVAGVSTLGVASAAATQPFKGVTLRWITGPHATTDAVQALLPQFEKETGMKVIIDMMDEEREFTKLTTEAAAGISNYDVISVRDTDIPTLIRAKIIRPIDDLISSKNLAVPGMDIDDYPEAAFDTMCRWYGKTWGLPYLSGATFLAYRTDWFKKAGLSAPTTWKDLFGAAQKLTKANKYGIVFRASRGHHAAFSWYITTMMPFGAEHFDYQTGVPTYNTPRSVESLEALIELSKYAPPGIVTFTHEEAVSCYSKGLSSMLTEADLLIPWIESADSDAAGNTEYLVIPKAYDEVKQWTGVCGWLWTVPTRSKNPEAAMAMIEYFTAKRNELAMIKNGGLAQRSSSLSNPDVLKKYPWYKHVLEAMRVGKWPHPRVVPATAVNVIVGTHVNAALSGQETPKEALDKAEIEVYNLMKDKGMYERQP